MQRSFLRTLFIILSVFVIYGCKPKPLDIDIKPAEEKIVISSQLLLTQGIAVNLTKSFSSLDNLKNSEGNYNEEFLNKISIKNALVTITYNNETDTLNMLDNASGLYYNLNIPHYYYQEYVLNVWEPYSHTSISASSILLPQVNFQTISTEIKNKENENYLYVNYTIKDLDFISNWFMVSYSKLVNGKRLSLKRSLLPKNIPLNKTSLFVQNPEAEEIEVFSDKDAFNNIISRTKKLNDVTIQDTIIIALVNIEEGYFNFLDTKIKAGGLANSLGNEPINYKTNVKVGYGYFTTHNPYVVFLNKSEVLNINSLNNIEDPIFNVFK